MGDWCDYEIKPVNGTTNLAKELVDRGLANVVYSEDRQSKSLSINIKEIAPYYHKDLNKNISKDDEIDWIKIGLYDDGSLYYVHKWGPNDALLDGISRVLPDVVLQVTRDFEWYESVHWWEKNGELCSKTGELVVASQAYLMGVKNSQVRETSSGNYEISLPIGDNEDNIWGTFTLPADEVYQRQYENFTGDYFVPLVHESYGVAFKGFAKEMSAMEIAQAYRKSKEAYRDKMNKFVEILPSQILLKEEKHNRQMDNSFFVIKVACSTDFSPAGYFTAAVSSYDIRQDGTVELVQYGKHKNVYIYDEHNVAVPKSVSGKEIKQAIKDIAVVTLVTTAPEEEDYEPDL